MCSFLFVVYVLYTCPDISISMIERTLKEMLDNGEIKKIGSGRSTAYVKK